MSYVQTSLFGSGGVSVDPDVPVDRIPLGDTSWVDVGRRWFRGSDDLFADLVREAPWRQGRRRMYDRVVDDPRWSWAPDDSDEPEGIRAMRVALEERYGSPFGRGFCNYYRDGNDSVAPHGDRGLRDSDDESLVAVVTLGSERAFLLRPKGGGRSIDLRPGPGDLLVMGGHCQRDFEHGVPKRRHAGPRISVSFRSGPWIEPDRTGATLVQAPR